MRKIPIIGIYKIISPSGKIYIGQSINIEKRFIRYKEIRKQDNQIKIQNSFRKYGFEAHKFEIIEECSVNRLDELEIWYKLCCVIDMGWSNCLFHQLIDGKGNKMSEETRLKMSQARIGRKESEETRQKKSNSKIGIYWADNYKVIHQYDLEENFIKEWNSIKEAKTTLNISNVGLVLSGANKTAGGYLWKYKTKQTI